MARKAVAYLRPPGAPERKPDPVSRLALLDTFADAGAERAQLALALDAIAAGEADTLYVERLGAVAGSLTELLSLVEWLAGSGGSLLAADVGLDTATAEGRRTVAVLREVDRWGREPDAPRRPRGRPGLAAGSPELAERIGQLRERGLSLHAIADQLNAAGIPTPRGGAMWRASSVQSALGYQRPRPPAHGAPPPHGHRKGAKPERPGKGPKHHRPGKRRKPHHPPG